MSGGVSCPEFWPFHRTPHHALTHLPFFALRTCALHVHVDSFTFLNAFSVTVNVSSMSASVWAAETNQLW